MTINEKKRRLLLSRLDSPQFARDPDDRRAIHLHRIPDPFALDIQILRPPRPLATFAMRQTHFLLVIAIAFDGAIHDFGFARSHAIRDLGVVVMGRRRPLEGCELLCLGGVHDVDVGMMMGWGRMCS
jgi:hypothetical protein